VERADVVVRREDEIMTELMFTHDEVAGRTVLAVAGEIDTQTADELRGKVDELDVAHRTLVLDLHGVDFVDSSGLGALREHVETLDVANGTLVLDLAGVGFIDSSGLGALLGIKKQQDRGGGSLQLTRMSDAVSRIIEITKMDRVFDVE
jgi:anti-anti-sigma factor